MSTLTHPGKSCSSSLQSCRTSSKHRISYAIRHRQGWFGMQMAVAPLQDGVPLTNAGRDAMVAGMNAAFAAAAEARARGQHGNGCVIVDPVTGEVVASGSDNSVAHPLK